MSYLLDKKLQRKRIFKIALGAILILTIFYFNAPIWGGLSSVSHTVFRPVIILKNHTGGFFSNFITAFKSKNTLEAENESLKLQLAENEASLLNYDTILDENNKIKEILGRKGERGEESSMIISAILGKPNNSPYDTLVIDAGTLQGVEEGDLIFALGDIPIGRVATIYPNSSNAVLFSNSGEKTEVIISGRDVFMEIVGRGGGNFEMILPRDFTLPKGATVSYPGIFPYVVAVSQTIISDPRDSFAKALLTSPVNIQELKFVQVKSQ